MLVLVTISATVVLGGVFFTFAGFFTLIGVTYDSAKSLWLFIAYCIGIGILFELLEQIIVVYIIRMTTISNKVKKIGAVLIKFVLTWFVIHIVNELMTTVSLSQLAELLTVLLMVTVDFVFDGKEKTEDVA